MSEAELVDVREGDLRDAERLAGWGDGQGVADSGVVASNRADLASSSLTS